MKKATKRTIAILLGVLCLAVAVWAAPKLYRAWQAERIEKANLEYPFLDSIVIKRYRGKDYYVAKKPYEGEYDWERLSYQWVSNEKLKEPIPGEDGVRMERHVIAAGVEETKEVNERPLEEAAITKVMDYEEYVDYCEEWQLFKKYSDPDMKYIVRGLYTETYAISSSLSGVGYEGSTAVLYFVEESSSMLENEVKIYIIPTDQDVNNVEVVQIYDDYQYGNILQYGQPQNPNVVQ